MCVSLLVLKPQCASEVIQVSVGAFALQTTRQRHQILQGLSTGCEWETLNKKLIKPSQGRLIAVQKRKVHIIKQVKREKNRRCKRKKNCKKHDATRMEM